MGRTERLQEPREAGLIGGDVGAEGGGEDHGESISSGNILFTFNDSLKVITNDLHFTYNVLLSELCL